MLKRKMMERLMDWKRERGQECLLVKGARQTGKTFIVEQFGKENYDSFIEINFEETPSLRDVFDGDLAVPEMIKRLSLVMPGVRFIPGRTLLFLDEVQACPRARASLKFWALDGRFDVIATGSLLGINYRDIPSLPVGYERQVEMHSLDLEEFLWAIGLDEEGIGELRLHFQRREPVPESVNAALFRYLGEYMAVGGMPAVVNRYLASRNFNDVHEEQQKILASYLDDIAKYADAAERPKARNCYLSIPRQLARENRKFQFASVEGGGSARKFGTSLAWLRDANLARFCLNVSTPTFPLAAYEREDQYKLYVNDIGLLIAMYGYDMKAAVIENTLKGPAKGGVYENLVADILTKRGQPLYYYKHAGSTQEIEFLLTREGGVIPVEVKSKNGTTPSLDAMLKREDVPWGYKLVRGNVGVADKKITLPLYMALFI